MAGGLVDRKVVVGKYRGELQSVGTFKKGTDGQYVHISTCQCIMVDLPACRRLSGEIKEAFTREFS